MVPAWSAIALLLVSPAPGRGSPERVDLAATAQRLDTLYVRIAGHRAERQAAELINYHRVEGGVARCMWAAGRPFRARPFASGYDEFTDADLGFGSGRGSVADSITDRGRSIILHQVAAARLAPTGVLDSWGPTRPADVATLNRCTAPYQHQLYLGVDPPAGVYPLSGFPGLLDAAERDPAVIAAMRPYRACMKNRYGYDVAERTDFLFQPRISYRDAPRDGRPPAAAWTRGVRRIHAAFDADVACRLPAYRIALRLIAARLPAWERRHRKEIDAVRAAWKQRVAQARHLPRTIS
ncbi:hypothetical protein Ani05nite_09670 [Amorphoplanes nipponensis]|uniref:Uncharacterized protein n=2 Tax=Actinoplanes nipponensis TaxID=135950 RepID=A0A919MMH7_9ACTN|nr:hypothetical protein Ani05nite_09670 [Actinoplanes nipponensis]